MAGEQTLAEFRTDVRYQLGNRTDLDPADPSAAVRLNRWLNRALRWAANPGRARHPELQKNQTVTLLNGTVRYALPANLFAIRFVTDETSGFKYDPTQNVDFLDRGTASARVYSRDARDLLIRGDASNAGSLVRVYYWATAAPLAADGDTSPLAEYWDEVILQRATALGAAGLRDLDAADFFNNAAAELVNDYPDTGRLEAEDTGWRAPAIRGAAPAMRTR